MKTSENISKKNPFKVPENYFETLTERTMQTLANQEEPAIIPEEKKERRIRLRPFIAMAASMIGIALVTAGIVRLVSPSERSIVGKTEITSFTEAVSDDIDLSIIEDAVAMSDENATEEADISSEIIIEYLVQENIDLSDIYEIL